MRVEALPAYRLTHAQAAVILGVRTQTVSKWAATGRLPTVGKWAKANLLREDVERLSVERWRPGDPAWLTVTQVAKALGVSQPRVSQLAKAGKLPYRVGRGGRKLFRRGQVEVIGRARRERRRVRRDPGSEL